MSLDHLWIFLACAIIFFLVSIIPIFPNDFWWHLKVGEIIYNTQSIPRTDMFSWTLPANTPYHYGVWLSELLFFVTYKFLGIELIVFLRNISMIACFMLIGKESYRRSKSWRTSSIVVLLSFLLSASNLTIRPQSFSWLPFVIFYILLSRYRDRELNRKILLLLPMIMVFWVNIHGSFVLGCILLVIFLIDESINLRLQAPINRSFTRIRWLSLIFIFTLLATLLNPEFINQYNYVFKLLTDSPTQQLITEWQPPSIVQSDSIIFYLSILLLLATITYSNKRLRPFEFLTIIFFLWLGWSAKRYVGWYGFVTAPIIGQLLNGIPGFFPNRPSRKRKLNLFIAIVIVIPGFIVQPWMESRISVLPYLNSELFNSNEQIPLLSSDTPVGAVNYIKSNPSGRMFNEMGYGSYLIWALPQQKVFIDPRIEVFPYRLIEEYILVNNGLRYNEILSTYGIETIILSREKQIRLTLALQNDDQWIKKYEDKHSQVWSRKGPRP